MANLNFPVKEYERIIADLEPEAAFRSMAFELGKLYLKYLEEINPLMDKKQFLNLVENLGDCAQEPNDRNAEVNGNA